MHRTAGTAHPPELLVAEEQVRAPSADHHADGVRDKSSPALDGLRSYALQQEETARLLEQLLERQAEDFRARERWHSDVLQYVSSEFREPLTMIIDPLERVLSHEFGRMEAPARRQIIRCLQSAQRLNRLVDQVSDVAMLDAGEMKLDVSRLDLVSFLSDFVESFERKARWNRIQLWFDAEVDKLDICFCPQSIIKSLGHLLTYVFSVTPNGGSVRLAVEHEGLYPQDDAFISISSAWSDGVTADLVQLLESHLPPLATSPAGLDSRLLGLLLAMNLVALHGGDIRVRDRNVPSIVVRLPKREFNPALTAVASGDGAPRSFKNPTTFAFPVPSPAEVRVEENRTSEGRQVLLVDDNASFRSYLRESLSKQYVVSEASDGREALREIHRHRPDLILCDFRMPGLDGGRLLQILKSNPQFQDIPFILLTSQASEQMKVQALEAGAVDFLLKPIKLSELQAKIHNVLAAEDRERQAERHAELARRQMLQYQLNPHFLFNALNSLRALVLVDGVRARQVVTELSEYLRYALRTANRLEVPLDNEMTSIRSYLEIQKIRFEDDLEFAISIDEDARDVVVPSLILQPLVENAVKYGMKTSPMPLEVKIDVVRRRNTVRLRVSNTGSWVREGHELGTGTGLQNIRQRLETFFPRRHRFGIHEAGGRVSTEIKIRLA